MNNENKDQMKNEDKDKKGNEGNKAPDINTVEGQVVTENKARAGEIGGIKPSQTTPKTGGRQGGGSVEDGGQDMGSSAGS